MEFDFVQFVSQVGFPIAVSAYLLTRLEKTIKEFTKVLSAMAVKLGVYKDDEPSNI